MPPDPRVHVGVGAIVRSWAWKHGEQRPVVLMIRRVGQTGFAADGHDTWSVPGGWIDHGETPFAAAVREVREETGMPVVAQSQAGFVLCKSEVKDISIVTLFVECYVPGGWDDRPEPQVTEPDKCADVGWLTWSEVKDGRPLFAPLAAWLEMQK